MPTHLFLENSCFRWSILPHSSSVWRSRDTSAFRKLYGWRPIDFNALFELAALAIGKVHSFSFGIIQFPASILRVISEFGKVHSFYLANRAGRRRKQRGRGRGDPGLHLASPTSYCNGRIVYPKSFSKPTATASPSMPTCSNKISYTLFMYYIFYSTMPLSLIFPLWIGYMVI